MSTLTTRPTNGHSLSEERRRLQGTPREVITRMVSSPKFQRWLSHRVSRKLVDLDDPDAVEDVVQDINFALLKHADKYDPQYRPLTFVKLYSRQQVDRWWRLHRKHRASSGVDFLAVDKRPTPDVTAERSDLVEKVMSILGRFPEQVRKVYLLRHAHGCRYHEMRGQCCFKDRHDISNLLKKWTPAIDEAMGGVV